MEFVAWLDDPSADPVQLGGKGGSLATLHRAGFAVPPGFCVTASGYHRFIEANGLARPIGAVLASPDLKLPRAAREACAVLTEPIDNATLPEDLAEEIRAAYAALRRRTGDGLVVAARSSALSEDAAGASSAGLYETYLNLRDQAAVLDGVTRCYRSLWTPRAVQYRAFKGIDSAREAMAVVVMEMVNADVAGVAFTVNPLSGDHEQIMINASWGLGEAIVSGRVTPDQFIVNKTSLALVAREIYPKEIEVLPDPSGSSGIVQVDVPAARATAAALSDEQVLELARVCRRVEEHYECPMDVEWAFAGRSLFILQARPVTGLAAR
jgi:pyruvate,water dikinase